MLDSGWLWQLTPSYSPELNAVVWLYYLKIV
jgi:hypothetical protein